MFRFALASIGGFFLIFIEIYIVIWLKGYYTIDIGGIGPFMKIWALNFFFLFTMFSHIQLWINEKEAEGRKTFIN